jgi:hypothetical protein
VLKQIRRQKNAFGTDCSEEGSFAHDGSVLVDIQNPRFPLLCDLCAKRIAVRRETALRRTLCEADALLEASTAMAVIGVPLAVREGARRCPAR